MNGRVAWVTGASTGIGRAIASQLLDEGWTVAVSARSVRRLNAIPPSNGVRVVVPCDVRNEASVGRAARMVERRAGAVSLLVNCAGITAFREFRATTGSEFRAIVETNLNGVFYAVRAVLPGMVRRRGGMIVSIISYAAKTTYTKSAAYTASKTGVEGMLRVLREEVRSKGVRVLNVFPGAISTPMWSPAVRRKQGSVMMAPEEAARCIVELTRDRGRAIPEEIVIRPPVGDLRV